MAPEKAKFMLLRTVGGAVTAKASVFPSRSTQTGPLEKRPWKYGAGGLAAPSALVAANRLPVSLRLSPNT